MEKVVAIVGPTASGKTSLASYLSEKFRGEIISIDSRQVYKEMEIGTGRLRVDKIPTHLQNLVFPDHEINAHDYSLLTHEKIKEILSRNRLPFLVGGSGFYLDVILNRVKLAEIKADETLRQKLSKATNEDLIAILDKIDPKRRSEIDLKNRYRLLRAVEIAEMRSKQEMKAEGRDELKKASIDCLILGLTATNGCLFRRADERVDLMIERGLVGEAAFLTKKYGEKSPGLKTLGYRGFARHLAGVEALDAAIQRLKFDTHAYIRRQKTYFKRNKEIIWFNIEEARFEQRAADRVELFLE